MTGRPEGSFRCLASTRNSHGSGIDFGLTARLKTSTAPFDFRAFGQSVTIIWKRIAVGEMGNDRDTDGGGRLLFYDLPRHGEDQEDDAGFDD